MYWSFFSFQKLVLLKRYAFKWTGGTDPIKYFSFVQFERAASNFDPHSTKLLFCMIFHADLINCSMHCGVSLYRRISDTNAPRQEFPMLRYMTGLVTLYIWEIFAVEYFDTYTPKRTLTHIFLSSSYNYELFDAD